MWFLRLVVRTLASHAGNTGSNPVGITTFLLLITSILKICKVSVCNYTANTIFINKNKTIFII